MKIDNLISNLQKNTAEQDEIIKEQAKSVTTQHLTNYNALLKTSNEQTKKLLIENLQTIKDQQLSIKKALRLNILTGVALGIILTMFLGLIGLNVWLGYQINQKQDELTEINLQIDKTPLEKRILQTVILKETEDKKGYLIIAKNSKKADAYTSQTDHQVLKINK